MKLNKFFRFTLLVFLFALPFLISCGEDREMHSRISIYLIVSL